MLDSHIKPLANDNNEPFGMVESDCKPDNIRFSNIAGLPGLALLSDSLLLHVLVNFDSMQARMHNETDTQCRLRIENILAQN